MPIVKEKKTQSMEERLRPHEGRNLHAFSFVAGREAPQKMFDHSTKVLSTFFEGLDEITIIVKGTSNKSLIEKAEAIENIYTQRAEDGVRIAGVAELNKFKSGGKAEDGKYTLIREGYNENNLDKMLKGVQNELDSHAKTIWGRTGKDDDFDRIFEEARQYRNKSLAITKAPIWRRGSERLWQFIGNTTQEQYKELERAVEVFRESDKKEAKGKWIEDYARDSFVAFVLAKAKETATVNGIMKTIEDAIKNPDAYSSVPK